LSLEWKRDRVMHSEGGAGGDDDDDDDKQTDDSGRHRQVGKVFVRFIPETRRKERLLTFKEE